MKYRIIFLIHMLCYFYSSIYAEETPPVSFKGRFIPIQTYPDLWLQDFAQNDKRPFLQKNRPLNEQESPLEMLMKLNILGHSSWDDVPLFKIHYSSVKKILRLESKADLFSYRQIISSIKLDRESNLNVMRLLLVYQFIKNYRNPSNKSRSEKQELTELSSKLWVMFKGDDIILASSPRNPPWNFLEPGMILAPHMRNSIENFLIENRNTAEELISLLSLIQQFEQIHRSEIINNKLNEQLIDLQHSQTEPVQIANLLDKQFSLNKSLKESGHLFAVLPSRSGKGEWFPLNALKVKIYDKEKNSLVYVPNFTLFSENIFLDLRALYFEIEDLIQKNHATSYELKIKIQQLTQLLAKGYTSLAGTIYQKAEGKALYYPTEIQLEMEAYYYRFPFLELTIAFYFIALLIFFFAFSLKNPRFNIWAVTFFVIGFFLHTALLGLRCFILQRPPVSNMYETVIYVPWISVVLSFILLFVLKNKLILFASALVSLALLILLKSTGMNDHLENVQAVLDSQYWLIIHVLMVVGSYGAFALSGLLGHAYLAEYIFFKKETPSMEFISKFILHSMYMGVALLIPGTILGGVWAAESWGRFWDWDPKESWAFISSCIYLIWIHAHTFHYVGNLGLAIGSVTGLIAISFTWYGVNYILGTGLHSYGFGKGGEIYYYLFLGLEIILFFLTFLTKKKELIRKSNLC